MSAEHDSVQDMLDGLRPSVSSGSKPFQFRRITVWPWKESPLLLRSSVLDARSSFLRLKSSTSPPATALPCDFITSRAEIEVQCF